MPQDDLMIGTTFDLSFRWTLPLRKHLIQSDKYYISNPIRLYSVLLTKYIPKKKFLGFGNTKVRRVSHSKAPRKNIYKYGVFDWFTL